jgi:predicted GNAT family N-acyltransferase
LDNGEVVACGGYERYQDEIILTWGMVRRDLHGQGYGNELTKFRLNAIKAEYPNHTIKIDTSQYSEGFYENRGFIIQDVEKDGFSPGLDKYIMTFGPP